MKPGRVIANKAGSLGGRRLGQIAYLSSEHYYRHASSRTLAYKRGDSFEYLQYRAEGSCLIRWRKEVLEVESCPWLNLAQPDSFRTASAPVTELWVRVTGDKGQSLGWLLIDDITIDPLAQSMIQPRIRLLKRDPHLTTASSPTRKNMRAADA